MGTGRRAPGATIGEWSTPTTKPRLPVLGMSCQGLSRGRFGSRSSILATRWLDSPVAVASVRGMRWWDSPRPDPADATPRRECLRHRPDGRIPSFHE